MWIIIEKNQIESADFVWTAWHSTNISQMLKPSIKMNKLEPASLSQYIKKVDALVEMRIMTLNTVFSP